MYSQTLFHAVHAVWSSNTRERELSRVRKDKHQLSLIDPRDCIVL